MQFCFAKVGAGTVSNCRALFDSRSLFGTGGEKGTWGAAQLPPSCQLRWSRAQWADDFSGDRQEWVQLGICTRVSLVCGFIFLLIFKPRKGMIVPSDHSCLGGLWILWDQGWPNSTTRSLCPSRKTWHRPTLCLPLVGGWPAFHPRQQWHPCAAGGGEPSATCGGWGQVLRQILPHGSTWNSFLTPRKGIVDDIWWYLMIDMIVVAFEKMLEL